jgi:hypothetical protein
MACSNLTAGLILDCIEGVGGIELVYIANGPSSSFTETNGLITAISVDGVPLTPSDFYKFEIPRQTSSFTETTNVSVENGTLFYNQDLSITFNKMDVTKRNQILLMAKATHMIVVFKDNSGKYWSVGLRNGAFMTAGSTTSGVAFGDRSGFEITLSGLEIAPTYEVSASIVVA